jgi:GTP:adenosylcobinamide-phosphate guanylyltransferase
LTCISQALKAAAAMVNPSELTCISLHSDGYANDYSASSERAAMEKVLTTLGDTVVVNSIASAAITAASIATAAVTKLADGLLAKTIDGTVTVIGALRRVTALATGLATGLNGITAVFKRGDGTTTAWTATQDTTAGDRTVVTPGAGLDTP